MVVEQVSLRFGPSPAVPPLQFDLSPVTIFVGPNNSGKSRVLAEIARFCTSGNLDGDMRILANLEFKGRTETEASLEINKMIVPQNPGEILNIGHVLIGGKNGRIQASFEHLKNVVSNPAADRQYFCYSYLQFSTLVLNGRNRIDLVNNQSAGDMQQAPQTSFQVLLRDDAKRHEVRRIVHEAFGSYFVVDPTNLGQLRVRLSDRAPSSDIEERGIHAEAVIFHQNAQLIDQGSDGVKAFTGIISEVIAGDPKVLLIDEPEAFLHPSLAAKLGLELSKAALQSGKNVFVSTHSPAFIMGCIQSGAPINVVRLTYRSGTATARLLRSSEMVALMRNPLLRSTGVLSGLFYEFVVVAESDADRAFYQEINERLLRLRPDWGISNCLFLNAQNKQTVPVIVGPLRQIGIPVAGIVDVDILKEGGTVFTNLMNSLGIPVLSQASMHTNRQAVLNAILATGKNMKRDGGLDVLQGGNREAAKNLFEGLAEYGLFAVPTGELESWLKPLAVTGHGPAWLIEMFNKMGEDPESPSYIRPTSEDVWAFIGRVKGWLTNLARKGIPS